MLLMNCFKMKMADSHKQQ
ncbi:hypothetical protein ACHAWO_002829 [Cyclotella atomus]|uniref:Uncharacterized protein n=1 Tax=Cyclotella atomus TaxID=382360 RepID=A0ABD3NSH0_9STRA